MIEGNRYINVVKHFFSFLELEFGMKTIEEKESGNVFYDVQYGDRKKIVSVSYENIEDYLQIIVFKLVEGKMPDYDDKTKTLHLNQLNSLVMPKVSQTEITSNSEHFSKYNAKGDLERKLLKGAKELRLCLKHIEILAS